jgi:hypothetical protein
MAMLAEDDQEMAVPSRQLEQHARGGQRLEGWRAVVDHVAARAARPCASALPQRGLQSAGPMVAMTTSSARPRSLMRSASSMAMASKGLMLSLTPSSITPEPSGFTRMRTL